ncbi:hypothetical protein [Thermosulfurimonas sp. F29]|uniref:hypothetical protein n=1 Tax=Thermosulfurimonas sp. F29 TaxID=2867247 RepID=UPI001C833D71|nr:hypothetical protein [Thermosulfurimonas sp. F29]MBX6424217.1 hypothetical protein [Thermosulfurimonas sp. F29]
MLRMRKVFGPVVVIKDRNLVLEVARRAREEGFFVVELTKFDLPARGASVAVGFASLAVRSGHSEDVLEEKARRLAEALNRDYENRVYLVNRSAEEYVLTVSRTAENGVRTSPRAPLVTAPSV